MTTRIVLIDYIIPTYNEKGDECGKCPRLTGKSCFHFGDLALRPNTKRVYLRHPKCIRAEERTTHAAGSALMMRGDFEGE